MASFVYVLVNESMPDLIKIGRTSGESVENRIRSLDRTGVPTPFRCFYAAEVKDAVIVERALHQAFESQRVRAQREFFKLSPDKAKVIIELVALREVTPKEEILTKPGDLAALEQKATTEHKKRFKFSEIGLKRGAILQSTFDLDIVCQIQSDTSIVFRGEPSSLSGAAMIVAKEKGYEWKTINGPNFWKYEGETLSAMRKKKQK